MNINNFEEFEMYPRIVQSSNGEFIGNLVLNGIIEESYGQETQSQLELYNQWYTHLHPLVDASRERLIKRLDRLEERISDAIVDGKGLNPECWRLEQQKPVIS